MGTRADFYVGQGKDAEWIGSVAFDGCEWGERIEKGDHDAITSATTEQEYRAAVEEKISKKRDGTKPGQGWPWPWEDSRTTDCAYCFVDGVVKAFSWGRVWGAEGTGKEEWPDITKVQNVDFGSRSGLIVLSVP